MIYFDSATEHDMDDSTAACMLDCLQCWRTVVAMIDPSADFAVSVMDDVLQLFKCRGSDFKSSLAASMLQTPWNEKQ